MEDTFKSFNALAISTISEGLFWKIASFIVSSHIQNKYLPLYKCTLLKCMVVLDEEPDLNTDVTVSIQSLVLIHDITGERQISNGH